LKRFKIVFISVVIISFLSQHVVAQSSVSGRVEEQGNKILPYVNVLLLQERDSSLTKGTISDEEGNYTFEGIKKGRYLIKTRLLGYKSAFSSSFLVEDANYQIDPFEMIQEESVLNEVTIKGIRSLYEQHIDRLVINVKSSISAAGTTALELLERSPGIGIDRQNNVLSMNGKGRVQVMINGEPSRLPPAAVIQMLEGMNAGVSSPKIGKFRRRLI
jgi:hypothetical protein